MAKHRRFARFSWRGTLALSLACLGVLVGAAPGHASGVVVTDLDHGGSATSLAEALAGPGVTVSGATFTGGNRGAGSFTGGSGNVGVASGIVLASGFVQTLETDTECVDGVEGPNDCNETSDGGANSSTLGQPGDSDLDTLIGGTTEDASVLTFDFVPQQSTLTFRYVFSSEEYNDYVNSSFNDVFAFYVNGANCAVVPGTSAPVSINTINNGDTAGENPTNPHLFRDNVRPTPGTIDSQMDGLTTVLTCNANVTPGETNTMKLAIADTSDSALDSAVFLEAGSLVSGRVLTVSKDGTGTGTVTSSPAGINCGSDCTESYADGAVVTLTPTAAAGSTFTGWTGACTGTGSCQVTMSEARDVTATFDLVPGNVLTVTKAGTGSGTVTSSPAGIECGSDCAESYADDTVVTLTPTPATGSTFAGWSGACSGTGTCEVTMSTARSVTATFTLNEYALTTARAGGGTGTISSSPAGIDCGSDCSQSYGHGTVVTLTATPAGDSTFTGWSGACSGTGSCQVTMTQARSVTATFAVAQRTLSVATAGTGSGGVASTPAGIDCGTDCTEAYVHGTLVTLTATAGANSTFTGWSGACTGTGGCEVTMDQARSVTATFATVQRTLAVTTAGTGTGGVTSTPAGIDCGADCSETYAHGTAVTLTAAAGAGSTFAGWSGGCSGTGDCVVTMDQARSVTATFTADPPDGGVVVPPEVDVDGLFCGVQHRGKCKGLKVKGVFDRPGNAVWTFDAYNPTPGNSSAVASAAKKVRLGKIKRTITEAGTTAVVFKIKKTKKARRLYRKVRKRKLTNIRVTLSFASAAGTTTDRDFVALER